MPPSKERPRASAPEPAKTADAAPAADEPLPAVLCADCGKELDRREIADVMKLVRAKQLAVVPKYHLCRRCDQKSEVEEIVASARKPSLDEYEGNEEAFEIVGETGEPINEETEGGGDEGEER
ncbi:MAG: hypothetical protein HYV08_12500 [Deltaproteobacteria bacterium]|nr:hypothetical protein [Deltaproteobacteria bacterium]MBI3076358.1 hypothetical protein [Deltaproteobacteria bacterium]